MRVATVAVDRAPSDTASSGLCPILVGRGQVLASLERRWRTARGGSGHLVLLAGEAGIGKSRLLAEVVRRAATDTGAVVTAAASPRDGERPGGVLAELAAELRRSAVDAARSAGSRMLADLGGAGQNGRGDAHRRQRLLAGELTDALISICGGGDPVLLAVEDLHWADDLTLDVLDRLARRLPSLPMLVIGTYRSDELYPRTPMRQHRARLLTQRRAEELRLPRLSPAETTAMAVAIVHSALPQTLVATVFERSDGIPLHVEEILRAARADVVPDTLADAIRSRTAMLTRPARAVAESASVIGRSFDVDLLVATTAERPDEVDAGLSELVEHHLIVDRPEAGRYDFRHALIRDALYADLAPLRRRELHARVARAAVAAGLPDAFLSDHFERAQLALPAYRHAVAAATRASAMSAHRAAVDLYRRAQRTTPASTPKRDRARLSAALAAELAAIDDNAAAASSYREAQELYRGLGDVAAAAALTPALVGVRHLLGADLTERAATLRAALSTLDDNLPDLQGRLFAALAAAYMLDRRLDEALYYGQRARDLTARAASPSAADPVLLNRDTTIGSVLVFAGQMDEGWHLLEDAVRRAREAGIEAEAARAYRMLGSTASVLVDYERGEHFLREGIGYSERTQRWNDRHYMAAHLAHVLWATGDWDAADGQARQALADGADGITTRITARHVLGYLALGRAQWNLAERQLCEAQALGEEMDEIQRLSPALWGLAEAALLRDDLDACVAYCERGYVVSASTRDAAYLFPYLVTGTRAHLHRSDPTAAREWIDRVERLLRDRAIPATLAAVDHAHGLVHLAEGRTGKARVALERASQAWQARRRFWEGTQAMVDLGRCAQRSRRPGDATMLVNSARQRAEAAGATALLNAIDSISTPSTASTAAGGLSLREIEVARLVATGATNRGIAESLHIAPKTVAAHVEHILMKLGAARRAEIAAWVGSQLG